MISMTSVHRSAIQWSVAAICVLTLGARATAQPYEERTAIGVWSGLGVPAGDQLTSGLHLAGTVERLVTPRVSIRGEVGRDWIGIDSGAFTSGLRPLFFNVNVIYKWDRDVWRPYVTAGLGWYHYTAAISSQALLDPVLRAQLIALGLNPGSSPVEGSDTKFGVNLGGGIEYFVSRQTAVAGEFRYHGAGDIVAVIPFEGSFLTFSAGLKRYF